MFFGFGKAKNNNENNSLKTQINARGAKIRNVEEKSDRLRRSSNAFLDACQQLNKKNMGENSLKPNRLDSVPEDETGPSKKHYSSKIEKDIYGIVEITHKNLQNLEKRGDNLDHLEEKASKIGETASEFELTALNAKKKQEEKYSNEKNQYFRICAICIFCAFELFLLSKVFEFEGIQKKIKPLILMFITAAVFCLFAAFEKEIWQFSKKTFEFFSSKPLELEKNI